jgi:predicted nucleic acid-binding protein
VKLYVDASVILRIVINARKALRDWKDWNFPTSSALLQVECLRTLDRYQKRLESCAQRRSRAVTQRFTKR